MIRALATIAVAGLLVSAVCLSVAVAITGPEAIARGAWSWSLDGWGRDWDDSRHQSRSENAAQTTRDLAWSGGDALSFELPADVQYVQSDGPAKLTVSGPESLVSEVEVEDGHVRYRDDVDDDDTNLTIVVTAPSVRSFDMQGSGKLTLAGYRQDTLNLNIEGSADITGTGETKSLQLSISGSGDARLGGLKASAAKVDIEGSGDATLAPTDSAEIQISGSGDVNLLSNPPKLQTNIAGSGRVYHNQDTGNKALPVG